MRTHEFSGWLRSCASQSIDAHARAPLATRCSGLCDGAHLSFVARGHQFGRSRCQLTPGAVGQARQLSCARPSTRAPLRTAAQGVRNRVFDGSKVAEPRRVLSLGEGGTTLGEAGRGGPAGSGDLDNFRKLSTHEHWVPDWCAEGLGTEHRFFGVSKVAGWIFLEKPSGVPRPPPHAVRSIASGAGPRSEGRCAPALRRASRPHHLVRVGGRVRRGLVVPSRRALAHLPIADGRRSGASTAAALWCAGSLRLRTMRASACATAKVVVARQHAVSVPNRSTVHGCGQGEAPDHTLGPLHATACSRRAALHAVARRVGVVKQRMRVAARAGAGWEGRCACRGVAGDVPGVWRGRRHARITQRRHVGELEPELYFLGVGG